MSIDLLLDKLDTLKFPKGEYTITCSGPMAIKGLREANDLDIIVTSSLWNKVVKKYKTIIPTLSGSLVIDNIEILPEYLKAGNVIFQSAEDQICNSESIGDFSFVQLSVIREYKKTFARKKDLADIVLIDNYLSF